jgi:PleD family two-component response regulator
MQQGSPLLACIGGDGLHPSFSEKKYFVTKCVSRGTGNTLTYIKESALADLLYNAAMANASHILVVDDHREIRELVSRALAKDGFRVSTAADGKAMRKVLADSRIDLVLRRSDAARRGWVVALPRVTCRFQNSDHHAYRQG